MNYIINVIRSYCKDLSSNDLNETARREKFVVLLTNLFPNSSDEIRRYTSGAEKYIKITGTEDKKSGLIDTFYGDLIIEFERSIPSKLSEARRQLREYCSGQWNEESIPRNYICIATDGINWRTFIPISDKTENFDPQDIELKEREKFQLSDDKAISKEFYYWLSRLFFREGNVKPTVQGFTYDFGIKGYLYERIIKNIKDSFEIVKNEPDISLAYNEWSNYLKYTYGDVKTTVDLFCRHTYLSVLARLIVWAALPESDEYKGSHTKLISDILDGSYFNRFYITNLVEKDFFHWIYNKSVKRLLNDTWLELLNQLYAYDFDYIDEDLLKGVYQELVDPKDRHDLGEYYTPDWLCELMVNELTEGFSGIPSILDPTCGSGSFLRASIHKIVNIVTDRFDNVDKSTLLNAVINNVVGIDIHPLAVTISKANYVLGLKDIIEFAKKPIVIPVYLADSLLEPGAEDGILFKPEIMTFDGEDYSFPDNFFNDKGIFDDLIKYSTQASDKLIHNDKAFDFESFKNYVLKNYKDKFDESEIDTIAEELFRLSKRISEKIRNNEDTIWSYIIRNNYAPIFIKNKFDIVIGNPPWISFRYISDTNYQNELKTLGIDKYSVAPIDSKLRTHMEIATIFLIHSVETYLKDGGNIGFVMPRSIFVSDHHAIFREEKYENKCNITEIWDLEDVKPLFKVPSCVVFCKKEDIRREESYSGKVFSGNLPANDIPLRVARNYLKGDEVEYYLSRLGGRTALTEKKFVMDTISNYKELFNQGATIVPRSFYFIDKLSDRELEKEIIYVKVDEEQMKYSKKEYKENVFSGNIEREFLYCTALARNLLPFCTYELPLIVLPVLKEDGNYVLKTASELRSLGYINASDWFEKAEVIWEKVRGSKADKFNIYDWLNYNNKLMKQDPDSDYVVIYNTSGMYISSAIIRNKENSLPFFAESVTYHYSPNTPEEARYLISILNSSFLDKVIKPFQAKGAWGERHIHKKPLEASIPVFNIEDKLHEELADLGKISEEKTEEYIKTKELPDFLNPHKLGKVRSEIREHLKDELNEVDKLVEKLIEKD